MSRKKFWRAGENPYTVTIRCRAEFVSTTQYRRHTVVGTTDNANLRRTTCYQSSTINLGKNQTDFIPLIYISRQNKNNYKLKNHETARTRLKKSLDISLLLGSEFYLRNGRTTTMHYKPWVGSCKETRTRFCWSGRNEKRTKTIL
jgi:hypothetical protein